MTTTQGTDFTIESVLYSSNKLNKSFKGVELRQITTDIDIYEDLNKPYITANIVILDDSSFISSANIMGGEKITIQIKSARKNSKLISKTFFINKILNQSRATDNAQVVILHLIEDCVFISNLHNLCRYYSDNPSEIIKKITNEFLNKDIAYDKNEIQKINVITPNLNPLQACKWIKNKMTTVDGYPYFFYSTLVGKKFGLKDLATLINERPINDESYIWSHLATQSLHPGIARRSIKTYHVEKSHNLTSLIKNGLIGAKYSFINTTSDVKTKMSFDFDIVKDVLEPAIKYGIFPRHQNNPSFTPEYKHDNKSYNNYQSRHIVPFGGSNPYRVTHLPDDPDEIPQYPLTLSEAYDEANYKQFVIAKSLLHLLQKAPINIVVSALDFIDGDKHSTIGNQIRCLFKKSNPSSGTEEKDTKLSGEYIIFRTRHIIKPQSYNISLNMVKLGDRKV